MTCDVVTSRRGSTRSAKKPRLVIGNKVYYHGNGKRSRLATVAILLGLWHVLAVDQPLAGSETAILRVIDAHIGSVSDARFTPDGVRVVTAGADHVVRLWSVADGKLLREFTAHTGPVYCLATSADGRWLASGAQDNTIRLWNLPLAGPAVVQSLHQGSLFAMARSPDGQFWASGGADRMVRMWWAADKEPLAPRAGHEFPIVSLAIRPDAMQVASGDEAGWILLWNPYLEEPQARLAAHTGPVHGIAFLNDNQRFVSLGEDGFLRLWQQPGVDRIVAELPPPSGPMSLVGNGPIVLVAGQDRKLRWVDLNQGQIVRELDVPELVTASACSSDTFLVAVGLQSGRVLTMRQNDATVLADFQIHEKPIRQLAFVADNQRLWSSAEDGRVGLWRAQRPSTTLEGHREPVTALAVSEREPFWLTASTDKTLRMWNIEGEPTRTFPEFPSSLTSVALRPDGIQVAVGDAAGSISLVPLQDGQPTFRWMAANGPIGGLQYSADSQSLISVSGNTVQRWRLPNPARIVTTHGAPIRDLVVVGELLVSCSADQKVRLTRWADGQTIREFSGSLGPIVSVSASLDGQLVVAGGENGKVAVWQTADGVQRIDAAVMSPPVLAVACGSPGTIFAMDSNRLYRWELAGAANPSTAPPDPLTVPLPTGRALCLAVAHEPPVAYLGMEDGSVWSWWASDGQWRSMAQTGGAAVVRLAWNQMHRILAAGTADGKIRLWKATAPDQPLQELHVLAHGGAAPAVAWAPQGAWLASMGDDGSVAVWNAEDGALWEKASGMPSPHRALAWLGADQWVAASGNTAVAQQRLAIARWQITSGPPLTWTLLDPYLVWCDGQTANCHVSHWDGQPQLELARSGGPVTLLTAHRPTRRLLIVDQQNAVEIWGFDQRQPTTSTKLSSPLSAVCWSADGQHLAIADQNNRVAVYDQQLTFLEATRVSLPGPVRRAILSSDGQRVVVAADQGSPVLLRAYRLGFASAGQRTGHRMAGWGNYESILVEGQPQQLLLVNAGNLAQPQLLDVPSGNLAALAVAPDGSRVLVADDQNRVWCIQLSDRRVLWNNSAAAPILQAAWSLDGQRIAFLMDDGQLQVLDAGTGLVLEFLRGRQLASFRWMPDNRSLLWCNAQGKVGLWTVSAQRVVRAHSSGHAALSLFSGGGQCATVGPDQRWCIWNTGDLGLAREITLKTAGSAIAIRPDNQRVALAESDGTLSIWNPGGQEPIWRWKARGSIHALSFSPDNRKLAIADGEGVVFLTVPNPPQTGLEYTVHQQYASDVPIHALVFAADSLELHGGDASGSRQVWLFAAAQPVRQFNHGGPVYSLAIDSTATTLVSASADQTVRIWDLQSGQQRAQLSGHQGAVYGVAVSLDGALAVSSGTDKTVRLWDVVGGRQLKLLNTLPETAYALAMHPQGRSVVAAGADRKAHLLDLLTGSEQRTFEGHPDYVHAAAFNPSGTRLVSYGYAGHLRIWNVENGAVVWQLSLKRPGMSASYDPEGSRLVLGNADGSAVIIAVPQEAR